MSINANYINTVFQSIVTNRIYSILILLAISVSVFIPSLKNEFVWDDVPYIVNRADRLNIRTQISEIFKESSKKGIYYRPILHLSLSADKNLWGLSAFGFHLDNILLQSLATILFYLMCLILLGKFEITPLREIAFLSSLIFALHPIHVEAVSFIMARSDLLCSIFLFGSFCAYIKSYDSSWLRNTLLILLSLVLFLLGLLSKEVACVFPVVVISYDLIVGQREFRRCLYRYLPGLAGALIYFYFRIKSHIVLPEAGSYVLAKEGGISSILLTYPEKILNAYGYYIYKLVFPFYFNAYPGIKDINIIFVMTGVCLLILIITLAIRRRNQIEKLTLFLLIWLFVFIAPGILGSFSSFVRTQYADRFLYIPSAGYCLLLILTVTYMQRLFNNRHVFYSSAIFIGVIVITFASFTLHEQFNWKDNLTLWRVTSKRAPGQMLPLFNYGMSLLVAGQTDQAINIMGKSLVSRSGVTDSLKSMAYNNLGIAYLNKHDYQNAELYFKKSTELNPNYVHTGYFHLGLLYYLKGNDLEPNNKKASRALYLEAEKYLLKSYKIKPNMGRLNLLLAEVYLKLDSPSKAKKFAKRSLASDRLILDSDMRKRASDIIDKQ